MKKFLLSVLATFSFSLLQVTDALAFGDFGAICYVGNKGETVSCASRNEGLQYRCFFAKGNPQGRSSCYINLQCQITSKGDGVFGVLGSQVKMTPGDVMTPSGTKSYNFTGQTQSDLVFEIRGEDIQTSCQVNEIKQQ